MISDYTIENFKQKLFLHMEMNFDLVVNENRSIMLNVISRKRNWMKISLHKMFLDAPDHVIKAVANYVRGKRKDKSYIDLLIRGYIQSNLNRFDYSKKLDEEKFVTLGKVYDLGTIFDKLNREYFNESLDVKITWYGEVKKKSRSRITFGQYFDHLKLIKMHRILDDPFFPEFYVEFVLYHEMIHHLVPGFFDEKGVYRVHGADFKERERAYKDYERAVAWEKANRAHFFKMKRG